MKFINAFYLGIALAIICLALVGCEVCLEEAKIISIGGCNWAGECGVMTDKGPGTSAMSVIGQTTTVFVECKK